jgi:hypothetical protein
MNVGGGASGHLPSIPDRHGPPQDCLGKLRVYGWRAILTHRHYIKPARFDPERPEEWRRHQSPFTQSRRYLKTGANACR